jgi:hypothetical protein
MDEAEREPEKQEPGPDTQEDVKALSSLQGEKQPELETGKSKENENGAKEKIRAIVNKFWEWTKHKAEDAGLHDWIMVIFTGVLTAVAIEQGILAWQNSQSSTRQMGKIIDAANRIEDAADSFSGSASHINEGVSDAVIKLQDQATKMDAARKTTETESGRSLSAAIGNFHRDQRAWLSPEPVPGTRKGGGPIQFPIKNGGKTPARNVFMYFMGNYFATPELITYEFSGAPIPLGYIAPNTPTSFVYRGQPQDAAIAANHKTDLFVVYGAITYDDVFSVKHWVTYCFSALVDGSTYGYCNKHNEIGDGPLPADAFKR